MHWIALYLPTLSLEACVARLPAEQARAPVALLDQHLLTQVNAAAAAAGLRAGQKRATALALCPELLLVQADAARDAQALQAVAEQALAFTPQVSLQAPDGVLLEVAASLHYFKGQAALLARLRQAIAPLGHRLQVACAPTALGAWVLARQGDGAVCTDLPALKRLLAPLPVWLIGPARPHWEALQNVGVTVIGDLWRLPRAALARRFSPALLDELDRTLGDKPDLRGALQMPSGFSRRIELWHRADTTDQVLAAAQRLLAELAAWLAVRQAMVGAFTLRLLHEGRMHRCEPDSGTAVRGPATELSIELTAPSGDAAHLAVLLREHLGHLRLSAPTLHLELIARRIVRGQEPPGELFPSHQSEAEGMLRLTERLQARLGRDQVQQLLRQADHRPEQVSQHLPAGVRPPPAAAEWAGSAHQLRPALLLPVPEPLPERGGQPLYRGAPLRLLAGPERIETAWWDGAPTARDYFIAQSSSNTLLWIFRPRLPDLAAEQGWFLHGRYA